MSRVLLIRDALGDRPVTEADFPLSVGGEGAAIRLAGQPPGSAFYFGQQDGDVFVQVKSEVRLLHNGAPVENSTWLNAGDVLDFAGARLRYSGVAPQRLLTIEDGSPGNATLPPLIDAAATSATAADDERIEAITFRAPTSRVERRARFSAVRMVASVAVVVIAAMLWFLFTATTVRIASDPAAAQVRVSGTLPAIPIGGRFVLRPGAYRVHLQHGGYKPLDTAIDVSDASNQQFEFRLAKLPGKLRIELPVTAQLSIDGEAQGTAPGEVELTPGTHQIRLIAARYQEFAGTVNIEGANRIQSWKPQLIGNWAEVNITSEPGAAEVFVAGESRGKTPLTTQLDAGAHTIELRLAGFRPWSTDVVVKANELMNIGPVRLGLPDGRLIVRSEPTAAGVTVAGVYRGVTPLTLDVRPELEQKVVVSRAGYESHEQQVSVKAAEQRSLEVKLAGIFGDVTVKAQPADAQAFVDGEARGNANQTLKLTATSHDIEIRKAGLASFKTSVTPRPGLQQIVTATLVTPEQSKVAALAPIIRDQAGGELKLMPTGSFTMGSPRREAGRRPNETQRNVELKRPFYLSLREVTNAEYRKFKPEHRSGFVANNTLDLDRQPAVSMSWEDAARYCNWLSQQEGLPMAYESKNGTFILITPAMTGYRLPTEAEWEWVARYETPAKLRRFPWGDDLPVPAGSGNFADKTSRVFVADIIADYEDGFVVTAPVGSFAANPLGLFDMGGNAAEWVNDFYDISFESTQSSVDPVGPADGKQRVIRGSSWRSFSITDLRLTARDFSNAQRNDVGFRVARYAQ